ATLIASLQTADSAIVADESDEPSNKKSLESDRSSQMEVTEGADMSGQAADQSTKNNKRLERGKRSVSPAPSTTEASSTAPMATRITRRSTRSEPQQQPSEDAPLATENDNQQGDAVASSHVEVVLESKRARPSKMAKGKEGRKKSVVDKRAAEPELSDEDKDDVEGPVDVALTSVYMEIDEEAHAPTMQTDEEHQQQTVLDSPETSVTHAEESVEVIDRFYAHQLQEIET
ncbi:hypothetical protein DFQ27_002139, partial [Actinomortierella ambigua]